MTRPFIAVHVGAGFHSDANSKELKSLCKKACKEAMAILREGASSTEAVVLAISILENSSQTNAALGSNLGLSGTVECDASLMDGQGNFGAVGAVEGIVNPVQLAHTLLKESSQGCLPLGRVPPLVLVGEGARLWARQHHVAVCSPDDLVTDRARSVYLDHITRLEEVTQDIVTGGGITEGTGDGLVSCEVGRVTSNHKVTEVTEDGPRPHHKVTEVTEDGHHKITEVTEDSPRPHHKVTEDGQVPREVGRKSSHQERLTEICVKKPRIVKTLASSSEECLHTTSNSLPDSVGVTSISRPCCVPLGGIRPPLDTDGPSYAPLDTVGAICLDVEGEVAAGVSSGGISLKSPGRVGQATMYGCGCWAENQVGAKCKAVASSTSGTGEYIIKTSLAKECALAMVDSTLSRALDKQFLNSKRLRNVNQKLAGAIVLSLSSDNVLHFSWGHTTESMCVGFMAAAHKDPTAIISKMEKPEKSGVVSHVQALRIHC